MTKIKTFILAILVFSMLILTLPPEIQAQATDIKVLSHSWYTSSTTGNFIVVGELQNSGTKTYSSATIHGIVYTQDGEPQSQQEYSRIFTTILKPQQTAPFYMEFTGESSVMGNLSWVDLGIDRIEFGIYGTTAESEEDNTDLRLITSNVDSYQVYNVSGFLLNGGELYALDVWVSGTYYDSTDTVVAIGVSDYIIPRSLPSHETATFSVFIIDPNPQVISNIASYTLQIHTSGSSATGATPTISPTNSPKSSTPTNSPLTSPSQNNNNSDMISISTRDLYIIIAVVIVAIVLVGLLFIVRSKKRIKNTTE